MLHAILSLNIDKYCVNVYTIIKVTWAQLYSEG